jgi:TPR repeat protein
MKIFSLTLCLFFSLFTIAHAENNNIDNSINKAKVAYQQQRYNDALSILQPAVDLNHPLSTYMAAVIHYQTTPSNKPKFLALMYFNKAAELGHTAAYIDIGFAYQQGNGVSQDFDKAHKYFVLAYESNDARIQPIAAYAIGGLYLNGLSVKKSKNKAREWYQKSANLGYVDAKTILNEIMNEK